ncbi:MAG: hypothetical protein ACFFCV_20045 [Promethearchaeota archaeon]
MHYTVYTASVTSMILYGISTAVTTSESIIRDNDETVTIMTGSNTLTLVSTNTADATAGDGAQSIYIVGLDENGDQQEETISLNGTVSAESTLTFSRINRAVIFSAGGDTTPVGTVYIGQGALVAGKPTIINGVIMPGKGWMRQGIISTPRNYVPYLANIITGAGKGKEVYFTIKVKPEGTGWIDTLTWNNYQEIQQSVFNIPIIYYGKSDVKLSVISDVAGTTCMGAVIFKLVHISLL